MSLSWTPALLSTVIVEGISIPTMCIGGRRLAFCLAGVEFSGDWTSRSLSSFSSSEPIESASNVLLVGIVAEALLLEAVAGLPGTGAGCPDLFLDLVCTGLLGWYRG